jgi:hypothetical protein
MILNIDYNIFLYLFFTFIIYASITDNLQIKFMSSVLIMFFLFKWITNFRKCTVIYIESKIRNIHYKETFTYNSFKPILDVNTHKFKYLIFICMFLLFIKCIYNIKVGLKN